MRMASALDTHSRSTLRALFQSIRKTSDAPTVSRNASRRMLLSNGIAAGDQIEGAVVAQGRRAFAFQPAPLHGEIAEQSGEELGTRQMHVRIE